MKSAKIVTEKVWVGNVKCRKILGFENIVKSHEVPMEYLSGKPRFCLVRHIRHATCYTPKIYLGDGKYKREGDSDEVVDFYVPRGEDPVIDMGGYSTLIGIGDVYPEETFQNILVWLRRAGERLAEINKKNAWSGEETVVI